MNRNILANYLGQFWSVGMSIVFVPVYIHYLTIEGFAVVGFFTVIQAWLTLLDLGMSPTLGREMARFSAGAIDAHSIRTLLHSLEVLCLSIAAAICLAMFLISDFLTQHWIQGESIPADTMSKAVVGLGIVVALRFVEGVYRSALFGLQRQVWFNGANAALATLRYGGMVVVLVAVSPTIEAFVYWQALVSMLAVIAFAVKLHNVLPKVSAPVRFSSSALADIRGFAVGMFGISLLGVLLTQVDKLLLSKLLPLDQFGYYMLASSVAGAMYLIIAPIMQAASPVFVQLSTGTMETELAGAYHKACQLITVSLVPFVFVTIVFPEGLIYMWSGNADLARNVAPFLCLLAAGTSINCLMQAPFHLQIAHGWTGIGLRINVAMVVILVPAILLLVPRYGGIVAAQIWIVLNVLYLFVLVPATHRKILVNEGWVWFMRDVCLPASAALICLIPALLLRPDIGGGRVHWLLFLVSVGGITLGAAALSSIHARRVVWQVVSRLKQKSDVRPA
jgi:O-antigen/teichoic acid export membrane protein